MRGTGLRRLPPVRCRSSSRAPASARAATSAASKVPTVTARRWRRRPARATAPGAPTSARRARQLSDTNVSSARDRIGTGPWFNAKGVSDRPQRRGTALVEEPASPRRRRSRRRADGQRPRRDAPAARHADRHRGPTAPPSRGSRSADMTCGNWTKSGKEGSGDDRSPRQGRADRPTGWGISWNSSHPTVGCDPESAAHHRRRRAVLLLRRAVTSCAREGTDARASTQLRMLQPRPAARFDRGAHLLVRVHLLRLRARTPCSTASAPTAAANCVRRPRRPESKLAKYPASTERVYKPGRLQAASPDAQSSVCL